MDLLTMFNPESDAIRQCSFLIISEIAKGDVEPMRLTAICPDYTYLTTCTGAILFPPGPWGETEQGVLQTIAKAIEPDSVWQRNTVTGIPIDAHVTYDHDGHRINLHFYALCDTYVGPITATRNTSEG